MLAFHSSYSRVTQYTPAGNLHSNSALPPAAIENSDAAEIEKNPPKKAIEQDSVNLRGQQLNTGFNPKTKGVAAYQEVQGSAAANPYAQTILNFVGLQLQRDMAEGATPEELQSRLEAGFNGFTKGYQEAFDQLSAAGVLSDDVTAAIQDTKNKVLEGINQLAEQYGLQSPVPEADKATVEPAATVPTAANQPVIASNSQPIVKPQLQIQSLQKRILDQLPTPEKLTTKLQNPWEKGVVAQGQARDFSFTLKTQDGDQITINASSRSAQVGGYAAYGINALRQETGSFDFVVEGELDEDELSAINDLLNNVGSISETFFNGDLETAFNQAVNMGYNADEISSFALSMTRVDVQKMKEPETVEPSETDYKGEVKNAEAERWQALGDFFAQLQDMVDNFQSSGLSLDLIGDVAEQYATQVYGEDTNSKGFGAFMREAVALV